MAGNSAQSLVTEIVARYGSLDAFCARLRALHGGPSPDRYRPTEVRMPARPGMPQHSFAPSRSASPGGHTLIDD